MGLRRGGSNHLEFVVITSLKWPSLYRGQDFDMGRVYYSSYFNSSVYGLYTSGHLGSS